ncbi:MAG: hypothetical protein GXP14_14645 [Gammaproteobacteria bacterium]|nr:hypothetical protein [Gammaproteobacteria bacterium]
MKKIALIFLSSSSLLILALVWIVTTSTGSQWAIHYALKLSPQPIMVAAINGTLSSGSLTLSDIQYRSAQADVHIEEISILWEPDALFKALLKINRLAINNINIQQHPLTRSAEAQNISLTDFYSPISIKIQQASINDVVFINDAEEILPAWSTLSFTAALNQNHLTLEKINITTEYFTASGQASLTTQGDYPFELDTLFNFNIGELPPIALQAHTQGNLKLFDVNLETAAPYSSEMHATVSDPLASLHFDMVYQWSNLNLPIDDKTTLSSPGGILHLSGDTRAYDFTLASVITHSTEGAADITLTGQGSPSKIVLSDFSIQQYAKPDNITTIGSFNGQGEITLSPQLSWDIALVAKRFNPGYRWPDFAGQLGFNATLTGTRTENNEVSANLVVKNLHGNLRKQTVSGYAQILYDKKSINFSPFVFSFGENHVVLSGELSDQYHLSWLIDAPRLNTISKEVSGNLLAQGVVTGSTRHPHISGKASSSRLRFQDQQLDNLHSNFNINFNEQSQSHIQLTLKNLGNAQNSIDVLTASLNGTPNEHKLKLLIKKDDMLLNTHFQGQYQQYRWQGKINDTFFESKQYGDWQAKPSTFSVSKSTIKLAPWCWLQGKKTTMCFNADWQKSQTFLVAFNANAIPLSLLQDNIPNNIQAKGYIDLSGQFSQSKKTPIQGKITLHSPNGSFNFSEKEEPAMNLNYRDALFELSLSKNITKLSSTVKVGEHGNITASGEFTIDPLKPLDYHTLQGQGLIQLDLEKINFLPNFVPEIGSSRGKLKAQINYSGTLAQPQLHANISLDDGRLFLIRPGITLSNLSFQSTSHRLNQIDYQLQAASGPGQISVKGMLQQNDAKIWQTSFNIKGERFQILNLPEYEALISPDIDIELSKEALKINGVIGVPYARLEPTDLSNAVAISPDVKIISPQNQTTQSNLPKISTMIRLELGDEIKFKGLGLETEIQGMTVIMDTPDQLTSGIGELRLNKGKFKAYGQDLNIDRGRFIFVGGPIDDPGLDILASRQPEKGIRVGVNVQGPLSAPEMSLFSEPAMDHTDALSYLILGRSMREKGSRQEGKLLLEAANQLSMAGGDLLTRKISKHFGIDDIRVDNVGDTFNPTLVIRQVLSSKWSIEASRGRKNYGTDLLYTIDRD